jgi:azurin
VQLCSGCQVNTHFFLVNNLGISTLHHYLRPIPLDSSLFPYHIHPYHFSAKNYDPTRSIFSSPILMAHTCSQEMESFFNTLQSSFLETQKEVQQLSATIASRDTSINTTINASV